MSSLRVIVWSDCSAEWKNGRSLWVLNKHQSHSLHVPVNVQQTENSLRCIQCMLYDQLWIVYIPNILLFVQLANCTHCASHIVQVEHSVNVLNVVAVWRVCVPFTCDSAAQRCSLQSLWYLHSWVRHLLVGLSKWQYNLFTWSVLYIITTFGYLKWWNESRMIISPSIFDLPYLNNKDFNIKSIHQ